MESPVGRGTRWSLNPQVHNVLRETLAVLSQSQALPRGPPPGVSRSASSTHGSTEARAQPGAPAAVLRAGRWGSGLRCAVWTSRPGVVGALLPAPALGKWLTQEGPLEEQGFKVLYLCNRIPCLGPAAGHLVSYIPAQADELHTPPPGSPPLCSQQLTAALPAHRSARLGQGCAHSPSQRCA